MPDTTLLWEAFGRKGFTRAEALAVLSQKLQEKEENLNVALSELRKMGRLEVKPDPSDACRKIYRLKE